MAYFWYEKITIMHYSALLSQFKTRRKSLKVNQQTLAEIADISLSTLKQFESGKGNPRLSTLNKLADALGMDLNLSPKKIPSQIKDES